MSTTRWYRAYLPSGPGADGKAVLDPEESRHLARVLRVRPGETIGVFDGRGGEWEARVLEVSKDRVVVARGGPRPGSCEPRTRVTIAQSLVRPERVEWVLEKGTEVGVSVFRLVPGARATAPAPSSSRLARYRRILVEACKQSGRSVIPELTLGSWPELPPGGTGIVLDPAAATGLLEALAGHAQEIAIAVGPEGGFEASEVEALAALGWRPVSLGPRVLRTETAGAIAAALVLFARGEMGPAPARSLPNG